MSIDSDILKSDIVKSFMNKYNFPKELKIRVIITDDIPSEYKKHQKRLNKKFDYISPIDLNGITCVPNTIDEETILLIDYNRAKDFKENNCEVICTIFHELIHAKDYYNYYKKYCNGVYDSVKNRSSQHGFMNWSEFNAKKISYFEYCKLVYAEKIGSKEHLKEIKDNELPKRNKELEDILKNKNIDIDYIVYNVMLYLGKYSVWEELFPEEFNNGSKFPDELNKYKPLVGVLYNTLQNNKGKVENYLEIKKLINYFIGTTVNIQSGII